MNSIILILVTVIPLSNGPETSSTKYNLNVFWVMENTFFSISQTYVDSTPITTIISGDIKNPQSAKIIYSEKHNGLKILAKILYNQLDLGTSIKFSAQTVSIIISCYGHGYLPPLPFLLPLLDELVENILIKGEYKLITGHKFASKLVNLNNKQVYNPPKIQQEVKKSETSPTLFAPAILSPNNQYSLLPKTYIIPLQHSKSPFINLFSPYPIEFLIKNLSHSNLQSQIELVIHYLSPSSIRSKILSLSQKYIDLRLHLPKSHAGLGELVYKNPLINARGDLSISFIRNHPIRIRDFLPRKQKRNEEVEQFYPSIKLSPRIFSKLPYIANVFRYDCNSLYPFIYTIDIPLNSLRIDIARNTYIEIYPDLKKAKELPKLPLKSSTTRTWAPYTLVHIDYKDPYHPLKLESSPTHRSETVIIAAQEAIALSKHANLDVTITDVFSSTKAKLFSLEEIVKLKQSIAEQTDKDLARTLKDILNIWWGKMAITPLPLITPSYTPDQGLIKSIKPASEQSKRYVGIHITSWARTFMLAFLLSPKYHEHVVYHDTDSLFTTTPLTPDWPNQDIIKMLPSQHVKYLKEQVKTHNGWIHPSQLGLFKSEGEKEEIIILAPKTYMTKAQNEVNFRIAGLHPFLLERIKKLGLSLHLFQLLKELIYWVHLLNTSNISVVLHSSNPNSPVNHFSLEIPKHNLPEEVLKSLLQQLIPSKSHFSFEGSIIRPHWKPRPMKYNELEHIQLIPGAALWYNIEEKTLIFGPPKTPPQPTSTSLFPGIIGDPINPTLYTSDVFDAEND